MTPPFAEEGLVTVTFNVTTLWVVLGSLLGSVGGGTVFILKWFVNKLDDKDKSMATTINTITDKFTTALKEERERAEKAEERSYDIHERTIVVVETIKGSLDRLVSRMDRMEKIRGMSPPPPDDQSNEYPALPPKR